MLWHNGGTGGFRSFTSNTHVGVAVLSNCSRSVDAIGFRMLEAINGLSAARPDQPLPVS